MSLANSSGFKYYMDQLSIDSESLAVAYDFANNPLLTTGYILPTYWSSGCYTGIANGSLANFSQVSGSGFFNSLNSVDISGSIPDDNFSFLFSYEKLRTGSEILLSSAVGSSFSQRSGVTLGINDLNKLFLEYWNPVDGKFSKTYTENIGSKNIVYFNKSYGQFNFGIYDPVSSKLDVQSIDLFNDSYSHSNKFRIGNIYSSNIWSSGNGFSGFIDDFYCLTGSFSQDYFGILSSGLYSFLSEEQISGIGYKCDKISLLTGSGVIIGTGVTGYETVTTYTTGYVPTGYYNSGYLYFVGTGVTGYENRFIGNIEDGCGFLNPTYVLTPLTGNIYTSGTTGLYSGLVQVVTPNYANVELTGVISGEIFVPIDIDNCYSYTGYFPPSIYVDSGFLFSLGFDSIYSIETTKDINSNEAYFYTTGGIYNNINLKPTYDSAVFDYKISQYYTGSGQNMFFNNGQLLLESGWSSYQSGYLTLYNITGNIFLDNDVIRSNGYNAIDDNLIYDHHFKYTGTFGGSYDPIMNDFLQTGYTSGAAYTGFGNPILPIINADLYFLNGIKLLSGQDYTNNTTSGLRFKFDIPASSVLTRVVDYFVSSENIYITGSKNLIKLNSGKFLKNTSQVYVNGMRQTPNYGYLEKCHFDLLSGDFYGGYNSLIFTSTVSDNFWNM
jgi:hypothetical protein